MRSEFGETDSNFGNGQIKLNPHLINETFQPFSTHKNLNSNFFNSKKFDAEKEEFLKFSSIRKSGVSVQKALMKLICACQFLE